MNRRNATFNEADKLYGEILVIKTKLDELFNQINNESDTAEKRGLYQRIVDIYTVLLGSDGLSGKVGEINDAYALIIDKDGSYTKVLDGFFSDFEEKRGKLQKFEESIFGKDQGTDSEIAGLEDRINDLYSKNEEKYRKFYEKIENELTGGITSVSLAKVFADKRSGYGLERRLWSGIFLAGGVFLISKLLTITETGDWITVLLNVIQHLPAFLAIGWLGFFISSRQAESRKLEESYTHKEVMATAYFGYKKTVEELSNEDNKLIETHMSNLLEAMKEDSSKFLSSEGEKHPLADIGKGIVEKIGFPEGKLESAFGSIELKKK